MAYPAALLGSDAKSPVATATLRTSKSHNYNRNIYYKNRLELSLETGWLPVNIPFVFDFLTGSEYNKPPLKYTLVPNILSLRWQMGNVKGPWILRGNWDLTASGSYTEIPRGPETRYYAYIMGIRRNFVRPSWRVAPYLEGRAGLGNIDAREPKGALFAQGQDFTFTVMLGAGLRYNINSRFAICAGAGYMHISNLYLSEPKYPNYGINVYGPMIGVVYRLGKSREVR
jgi:lipid A 3-O-deacylase PagL